MVAWLCVAGALLELACCWLCLISPELTAAYNREFTRQFLGTLGIEVPQFDGDRLVQLEVGLITMSLAYIAALVLLVLGSAVSTLAKRVVIGFSLLFHVTFLAMPGMYSTDIFSYVMYGRIAAVYGQNPYVTPPSSFGADPFLNWVFPFWQNTPTVYGPLWTGITALLSSVTANASALDQVLAYKLLIWTSALLNVALVWTLTRRVACFALYAWNPIVLFELAGNAHNDALMVTLLLLSIIPLTRRRPHWLAAIVIVSMSGLIKFATAPVIVFYAAAGLRRWSIALAAAAVSGLSLLLWWPYQFVMPSPIGALMLNSISELGVSITITRVIYLGVFAWDLVRVWRVRTPEAAFEASARALVLLPLLVLTWVWSWYFTWSIALAAVLGIRTRLAQTIAAFSVVAPPIFYAHQYLNQDMPKWLLLIYIAAPLLVLLRSAARYRMPVAREGVGV